MMDMELKVEELDPVKRKLNIKVPEDVVSQRVDQAYRSLNRQVRMPGFRPGKIPQKILEKQVPLASMTQLWQDLMQEYYEKALQQTGIVPAGPPEIDHSAIQDLSKNAPFSFSVVLDIRPSVKFKDYKGLKAKKREFLVREDELEASIRQHLEPLGRFEVQPDGYVVAPGDFVTMDFEGILDGKPLESGAAEGYQVQVGEKKMIPGFEDQLIGHRKDEEFSVKVQLPVDWNKKMRRVSIPIPGMKAEDLPDIAIFKVKIREIKKQILPELNDALVRQHGEESVESFKRKLKGQIQAMKDHAEETRIKQDIFDYLVQVHDVKPTESMVKQELKYMIDGMKFQIEQSGMKLEDSGFDPEQAEKEWRSRAEHNAKGYLILEGIATQEKISVSQSDMEEEYQRLAMETGKKPEEVKKRLFAHPEGLHQTSQRLRGQKALNLVFSQCELEYVKEKDFNEKRDKGVKP